MLYITVTMTATRAGTSMFDHQLQDRRTVSGAHKPTVCVSVRAWLTWALPSQWSPVFPVKHKKSQSRGYIAVYDKPIKGSKVTVINTPGGALELAQNELHNTNVNFGKCSSCF